MKYSYKWLKELSGTKKSPEEVAQVLIKHSFEVEEIVYQNKGLDNVVVGKVLEVKKHPNADKLNVAKVDIGDEILEIVCGAKNLEVDQKVPVAKVGAVLPTEDGEGFKIKKSKIRGVESRGMICAEDELGIGKDSQGIMVLSTGAKIGEDFALSYGLDDVILDIDVLPNRGHDALSHRAMAAEIASLEGRAPQKIEKKDYSAKDCKNISLEIKSDKCFRYASIFFDNLEIGESPKWMQNRLKSLGINPKNLIVDISNYVMLETGQPTHAYSAKFLSGDDSFNFIVKNSKEGQELELLNDEILQLSNSDLVIECNGKSVALAGVMGGKQSAVSLEDKSVVFEIASFDYATIRKTKTRYNLQTDAAYRFERDIDPNLIDLAISRIVELVSELTTSEFKCLRDIYPKKIESWIVELRKNQIERLLGIEIENTEIIKILESIGVGVREKANLYECKIPTVRRDLRQEADLIEEIGRIYGYDKILPKPLFESVELPKINEERIFERETKGYLVYSGFDEVKSYSFYSSSAIETLELDEKMHIKVLNPISKEHSLMRKTLISGVLTACAKNIANSQNNIRIFEIGRIYNQNGDDLPEEVTNLSILISTPQSDGFQFFELKGIIEGYLNSVGIEDIYFDDNFDLEEKDFIKLHGSRRALIKLNNGKIIGVLGEITKKTMKFFGIKKQRATICELDLDLAYANAKKNEKFEALSKFPLVTRDLSMIVESRTKVSEIERIIYEYGSKLLVDVDLFDLYINPKTQERSMAFHLIFSHSERTLNAKEVDVIIANIISALEEEGDAQVRR